MNEDQEWAHGQMIEWLGTRGYSLWVRWDLTDSKEVVQAADWFMGELVAFEAWLVSTGKINDVEQCDAGVPAGDQPYPTAVADPGLAERNADIDSGYLRRRPEQWQRALDGEV